MRFLTVKKVRTVVEGIQRDKVFNFGFAVIPSEEKLLKSLKGELISLFRRRVTDKSNIFTLYPVIDIMDWIEGGGIGVNVQIGRFIVNTYVHYMAVATIRFFQNTDAQIQIKEFDTFFGV